MPHPWTSGDTLPARLVDHGRALGGQIALRWLALDGWHSLSWHDLLDRAERQAFALHAAREADSLPGALWLPDAPGRALLLLALLHLPADPAHPAPALSPGGAPPPPPRPAPPRWLSRQAYAPQDRALSLGDRAFSHRDLLQRLPAGTSPDRRLYEIYLPTDLPTPVEEVEALCLCLATGTTLAIGPRAVLLQQLPARPRLPSLSALLAPTPEHYWVGGGAT